MHMAQLNLEIGGDKNRQSSAKGSSFFSKLTMNMSNIFGPAMY